MLIGITVRTVVVDVSGIRLQREGFDLNPRSNEKEIYNRKQWDYVALGFLFLGGEVR